MIEPELKVTGAAIDYDIAVLLGDAPSDFLVLQLDGKKLEGFGTPYDTPTNRIRWGDMISALNKRGARSLWPKFWVNWDVQICKQFDLPLTTTPIDFRPAVSFGVERVVVGYSEHDYAAIQLFSKPQVKTLVARYVIHGPESCACHIFRQNGSQVYRVGKTVAHSIALAVRDVLEGPR